MYPEYVTGQKIEASGGMMTAISMVNASTVLAKYDTPNHPNADKDNNAQVMLVAG